MNSWPVERELGVEAEANMMPPSRRLLREMISSRTRRVRQHAETVRSKGALCVRGRKEGAGWRVTGLECGMDGLFSGR